MSTPEFSKVAKCLFKGIEIARILDDFEDTTSARAEKGIDPGDIGSTILGRRLRPKVEDAVQEGCLLPEDRDKILRDADQFFIDIRNEANILRQRNEAVARRMGVF